MNRTDRLYAIVEELRAAAPRARTAGDLARHFEVSIRTIERDLDALLQAGVPIWATRGPGGGYTLDPKSTLPPVNFTATEAAAIAIALSRAGRLPFGNAARTALHKLVAAMGDDAVEEARTLVDRVRLLLPEGSDLAGLDRELEAAVVGREVVDVEYTDRHGVRTRREIEPFGFVGGRERWYLVGWCTLRDAARSFRVDRVTRARRTGRRSLDRPFEVVASELVELVRRPSFFDG